MTSRNRTKLLVASGSLTAAALLFAAPAAADVKCLDELVLPDDRTVVRFEESMPRIYLVYPEPEHPAAYPGSCVNVSGSGEIELTLALMAESPEAIAILDHEPPILQMILPGEVPVGRYWSEWLQDPGGEEKSFGILYDGEQLRELLSHGDAAKEYLDDGEILALVRAWAEIRFVWTLRRRGDHPCSMTMSVSGDASGELSGDVAYYNVFEQGVYEGGAAGTWADPGMQEMLGGMLEWAAGEAAAMEERGFPATEGATPEAARAYAEEMREWGGLTGGTDTFGLTLVDVKLDSRAPEHTESLGGAMATLASTAHVTVSGRFGETIRPQSGKGKALAWPIEISRVTAAAGVVDGNLDVVGYVWEPGKPGSASVVVAKQPDSPEIQGMVVAELFPDKPRPGAEGIRVVATFTAQQGAVSCQ